MVCDYKGVLNKFNSSSGGIVVESVSNSLKIGIKGKEDEKLQVDDTRDYTNAASGKFSECLFGDAKGDYNHTGYYENAVSGRFSDGKCQDNQSKYDSEWTQKRRYSKYLGNEYYRGSVGIPESIGVSGDFSEGRNDDNKPLAKQFLEQPKNTGAFGPGVEDFLVSDGLTKSLNERAELLTPGTSLGRACAEGFDNSSISKASLSQLWLPNIRNKVLANDLQFLDYSRPIHKCCLEAMDILETGLKSEITKLFSYEHQVKSNERGLQKLQSGMAEIRLVLVEFKEKIHNEHLLSLQRSFDLSGSDSFLSQITAIVDIQQAELDRLEHTITECRMLLHKHKIRLSTLETTLKMMDRVSDVKRINFKEIVKKHAGIFCDIVILILALVVYWISRHLCVFCYFH